MPQSLSHLLIHIIFSTKERKPLISSDMRLGLHAYLGGIIRELGGKPLEIGGTEDHVHILLALPAVVALADALRVIKTNSSGWVHKKWPAKKLFAWQAGYSAFSVSESNASRVKRYISAQLVHHARLSFQGELRAFLKKHRIDFDERHIWD